MTSVFILLELLAAFGTHVPSIVFDILPLLGSSVPYPPGHSSLVSFAGSFSSP